jgi:hypothetical protein
VNMKRAGDADAFWSLIAAEFRCVGAAFQQIVLRACAFPCEPAARHDPA